MACPNVKRLRPEELYRIRRLGQLFAAESKLPGGYLPEAHERVWRPLMEVGMADIFYVEDSSGELTGFLGASFVPDLYSGLPGAQAQFWYVDVNHRKGSTSVRLFNAFEKEAECRNTVKFSVGHKAEFNAEGMRNFFLRRGYKLGELFYWKNLCQ